MADSFHWRRFRGLKDPGVLAALFPDWGSGELNLRWRPVSDTIYRAHWVNVKLILSMLEIDVIGLKNSDYHAACYGKRPVIWIDDEQSDAVQRFMLAQMLYFVLNGANDEVHREHFWAVPLPAEHHAVSWKFATELLAPRYLLNTWYQYAVPHNPVSWPQWIKALFDKEQRVINKQLRADYNAVEWMADGLRVPVGVVATLINTRYGLLNT